MYSLPDKYIAEVTIVNRDASFGSDICIGNCILAFPNGDYGIWQTYNGNNNLVNEHITASNIGDVLRFEYDNSTQIMNIYVNNELMYTLNNISSNSKQRFKSYINRWTTFKDLKIMEL